MRIVLLTRGTHYAERILLGLSLRGLPASAVVLVGPSATLPRHRRLRHVAQRPAPDLVAAVLQRMLSRLENRPARLRALAGDLRQGGRLNSARALTELRSLEPDYLVLGGTGIVGGETLEIPTRATINAHPALLPWAPGVGVVERSIERRVPIGVTAHLVDRGIDTGPVIRRELVAVANHDRLATLQAKTEERCAQMLVELLTEARGGRDLTARPHTVRFPACSWPSSDERRRVEEAVSAGAARRLYERWCEEYGGTLLPLPGDPDAPEGRFAELSQ